MIIGRLAASALHQQIAISWHAGWVEGFLLAAVVYAVSNACIGATPAAYAADVMPDDVSGLGLGIYRCAGDLGRFNLYQFICLQDRSMQVIAHMG